MICLGPSARLLRLARRCESGLRTRQAQECHFNPPWDCWALTLADGDAPCSDAGESSLGLLKVDARRTGDEKLSFRLELFLELNRRSVHIPLPSLADAGTPAENRQSVRRSVQRSISDPIIMRPL
eukprot:4839936-Prymnesium_polylepis.2